MFQVLGLLPGSVVDLELAHEGQVSGSKLGGGAAGGDPPPSVGADLSRDPRAVEPLDGGHVGGAGQGEVASVGAVGPLAVVLPLDDLGDQAVEVQIALAMAVGAEVHLHVVDVGGEVRAVIEVEAPKEVLVGLAAAGVLGGDHAGHRLQQLGDPQQRPDQQVGAGDGALARGLGHADLQFAAAEHHQFPDVVRRGGDRGVGHLRIRRHRRGRGREQGQDAGCSGQREASIDHGHRSSPEAPPHSTGRPMRYGHGLASPLPRGVDYLRRH